MSGLEALITLLFEIRVPINPTWGSHLSVIQSDLHGEASETISVVRQLADDTGQTG